MGFACEGFFGFVAQEVIAAEFRAIRWLPEPFGRFPDIVF